MAQLIDLSLIPALDADGNPISGATLRFYQTGTLTPVTVFQDGDLTVPHPATITANSAGRFPPIYASGTQALRARLEQGVSILRDVDPIIAPLSGDDVGVAGGISLQTKLNQLDAADTALDARMDSLPVTPEEFGALGNGVANDTAAFQAALATKRPLMLGAKQYRINLVLTTGDVQIVGASWRSTILRPFDNTKPVIKIDGDAAGQNISNFKFHHFSILGDSWTGSGDGIHIFNTADTRGCDFMDWHNLFITGCRYGVHIQGRTIWDTFKQVNSSFNFEGWHIETEQGVNGLIFEQCQGSYNRRHGLFALKTGSPLSGAFLLWTFILPTFEANGLDVAQPFACGAFFQNVSNLTLDNPSIESNGIGVISGETYGIRVVGEVARGVVVRNGWLVDSKYPLWMESAQLSGRISNLVTNPIGSTVSVTIAGQWVDGNGKIIVDERTISGGSINYIADVNGSYQAEAIDYIASPTGTLDLRFRDKVQLNTGGGTVAITAINNTFPGDEFVIVAAGANTVTVAAGLMQNATLVTIASNTGRRFVALGAPNAGKFVAL